MLDEDVGPEFLTLFVLLFEARNGCDSGDIWVDIGVDGRVDQLVVEMLERVRVVLTGGHIRRQILCILCSHSDIQSMSNAKHLSQEVTQRSIGAALARMGLGSGGR